MPRRWRAASEPPATTGGLTARTAAGKALLAGDPHLDMSLPSLWYEAHLVVPGILDVYGVTIPGAPGIIIGFTRDVAWSFTNTGADVLDLYEETVDDAKDPRKYQLDGAWKDSNCAWRRTAEEGRSGRGRHVAVHASHPTNDAGGRWVSMRWTVLCPNCARRFF
jgi:penicillin amidase